METLEKCHSDGFRNLILNSTVKADL